MILNPKDKAQWELLFGVFFDGTRCEECPFHTEWREPHPYGEGSANENLRSCRVIGESRKPERCPGIVTEEENPDQPQS